MADTCNKIINDKTSGSAEISDKLLKYFYKQMSDGKPIKKEVEMAIRKLGHFAIISFHLGHINKLLSSNDLTSLQSYLKSVIDKNRKIYSQIYMSIPNDIKKSSKVFTISNSKTVSEVLMHWHRHNKKLQVIIMESQPMNEGRLLSTKLNRAGINTLVVADNTISHNLEESDLFLLGCDAILKNGDIINKSGSRDAAIIAQHFNKPVIVVSSGNKQINRNKYLIRGRNKSEKFLYEKVERSLITLLVTN